MCILTYFVVVVADFDVAFITKLKSQRLKHRSNRWLTILYLSFRDSIMASTKFLSSKNSLNVISNPSQIFIML